MSRPGWRGNKITVNVSIIECRVRFDIGPSRSRDFKFLKGSMAAAIIFGALPIFYLADYRQAPRYIFWGFLFTNVIRSVTAYYFIKIRYKNPGDQSEEALAGKFPAG